MPVYIRKSNVVRYGALFVGAVLSAVAALISLSFLGLDVAYAGRVFKGVSVMGVDIGGLSREEALEKLRAEIDLARLEEEIVLRFGNDHWTLNPAQLELEVDLEATVDKGIGLSREILFLERWLKRASLSGLGRDIPLVVRYDEGKLESFLSSLKSSIDCEPVDARIGLEGKKLLYRRSREGRRLDREEAWRRIVETLSSTERVVDLPIEVTPPKVTDEQVGKVIVVDKSRFTLTLYENMEVVKRYPVAVGMPSWPTPTGEFKVVSKQKNPAWYNPGSSWAANMPKYIPPGPGNPLGTRALALNASGVLIHGTSNIWSIGSPASHGCIRMYMRDVEDLFERVEVGTPVVIF
ncbi:MAG: L,D-transpeptidase/peptidoglycan binding protein [Candidatus Geothermincolales bacterium]